MEQHTKEKTHKRNRYSQDDLDFVREKKNGKKGSRRQARNSRREDKYSFLNYVDSDR